MIFPYAHSISSMLKLNIPYKSITLIIMESHPQLPLSEVMPLFSPEYEPKAHALFSQLKQRMQQTLFDATTNALAQTLLVKEPSNYNGWYCKKMYIMSGVPIDVEHQFQFTNSCLGEKAKSFQVWQQKRFLIDYHNQPQRESSISREVLQQIDSKNYHAWSFRTWLVQQHLRNWSEEIEFAQEMIQEDLFNNSAWSYRFFIVGKMMQGKDQQERKAIAGREVEYTLAQIQKQKSNRASWNYLRGLFPSIRLKNLSSNNKIRPSLIPTYDLFPRIQQLSQKWWQQVWQKGEGRTETEAMKNAAAQREILSTLVHIYSLQGEEKKAYAVNICQELAEKERQRSFYWRWVRSNL